MPKGRGIMRRGVYRIGSELELPHRTKPRSWPASGPLREAAFSQGPKAGMSVLFSEHFDLGRDQSQLDFVNIPLDRDITLFVDPYAFKIGNDQWSIECNNLVVDFFEEVLLCIRDGLHYKGRSLLYNLREPAGTGLGFSTSTRGRGMGHGKSADLYERLQNSRAAQTGMLRDLSECELLVSGIGPDTISDITLNVIRGMLLKYTARQCELLGVPTQYVQGGMCWSPGESRWSNTYARLPIYSGGQILLVPKSIVRYRIATNHQEYYRRFVLDFLQAEHLSANSSLVEVLKCGRRRVTKKSLEERFPCTKDFLFEFSQNHPEVLDEYRKSLPERDNPLSDFEIAAFVFENIGRGGIQVTQHINVNTNIGGAIGAGAVVNARDITQFKISIDKSPLPEELRRSIVNARDQLETLDLTHAEKNDVADSLGELTNELAKDPPQPNRIRRLIDGINERAPLIAATLQGIQLVADLYSG